MRARVRVCAPVACVCKVTGFPAKQSSMIWPFCKFDKPPISP